jgi:mono/diheme cytochrome c family protein
MRKMIFVSVIGGVLTTLVSCERAVENSIERGKYLVTIAGCNDCHTPKLQGPGGVPVPDTTRLLSGHPGALPYPTWTPADIQERNALALTNPMLTAWAGPWGVSFATNLTPDTATGIAEWTEQTFIQAMRTGKHQGQPNARDILPPMPSLKPMSESDLKTMWAYLRSIPPVKNQVPLPVPPSAPPMP